MSRSTTIARESLPRVSKTDSFPRPRSLATCVSSYSPVQLQSTEGLRMWLRRDSRVNRSAPPVSSGQIQTDGISGPKPSSAFVWYSRRSRYWKTSQGSFGLLDQTSGGTLAEFSEIWPRAGTMRDGVCYLQPSWERRIVEIESSYWSTPIKGDARSRRTSEKAKRLYCSGPTLQEVVRERGMWPTPTCQDAANCGSPSQQKRNGPPLNAVIVRYPTPTTVTRNQSGRMDEWGGSGSRKMLKRLMPTPVADDTSHRHNQYAQGGTALSTEGGGKLNPPWVEWLMGWPIEWTALEPLEMDRFQQWLRQSGSY